MKIFPLLILLTVSNYLIAQKKTLFESIEYRNAYEKKTRQRNGLPGDNYWQNRSDYEIEASFDPASGIIEGSMKVTYFNESPDSLNVLVFKLMQNIYKRGANRQIATDENNIHDGIKIENVSFNDKSINVNSVGISETIMRVSLPEFIGKNSKASITLDFATPLPKKSGFRSGTVDSTSFFAAYWFPQIAVYDDIFGWDTDEYVGTPENYNDFSNYLVEITIPSHYNIWATGEHVNKKEIFSSEILKNINASKKSGNPVLIIEEKDFREADGEYNTWKFRAENVPDFAWGASDHYIWEGVAANNPDPRSTCWVQSAYPVGANHFDFVISVAKKSVEIFSNNFPNIPYPYFKHVSFKGNDFAGGMEFPMLANNAAAYDSINTIMVTTHELAHNYFPFMMGINERKYGWWDETMTTLMESYVNLKGYPEHKVRGFFNRKVSFNYIAPNHEMLPIITETSNIMKQFPAACNFYIKGPAAIDILVNIIGASKFYKYTRDFMLIWKGKHPTPYDFFYFINENEMKNLNWFWDAWFFSYGYPDLEIVNAVQNDDYLTVQLKNTGGLPVQFRLNINCADGPGFDEEFNVTIWEDNLEYTSVRIPILQHVERVSIDDRFSYDAQPDNNTFILRE